MEALSSPRTLALPTARPQWTLVQSPFRATGLTYKTLLFDLKRLGFFSNLIDSSNNDGKSLMVFADALEGLRSGSGRLFPPGTLLCYGQPSREGATLRVPPCLSSFRPQGRYRADPQLLCESAVGTEAPSGR